MDATPPDGGPGLAIESPMPPGATPAMAAEPMAPALVDFGECPTGWAARSVDGAGVCEPWAPDADPTCSGGEGLFPSRSACVVVGDPCPAGDFPTALPAGPVRYVRPGATGGDGTMASPFGTVADALAGAPDGVVIALARGTHAEAVSIAANATLVGACAAETTIRPPTSSTTTGVVHVTAGDVALQNVTLEGDRPGLTARGAATTVVADGVVVESTMAVGVSVRQSAFDGRDLVIRGTRSSTTSSFGRGMSIGDGARVTLVRADIVGNRDVGILAADETTSLSLEDVVIRDTLSEEVDLSGGSALKAQGGVTVTLTRVALLRCRSSGVGIFDGSLDLDTVVVRRVRSDETSGELGTGIFASRGAAVTATRVLVEDVRLAALQTVSSTTVAISDSVLLDASGQEGDGIGGLGILADQNVELTADRVYVRGASIAGVGVNRSRFEATDLIVRDVVGEASGLEGRGIWAQFGTTALLERVLVERTRTSGVYVYESELEATDLRITEVRGDGVDGSFGRGLASEIDSRLVLNRAVIEDAREVALFLQTTTADLTDVTVRGTRVDASDGSGGRAMGFEDGVTVVAERLAALDNVEVGLFVSGAETSADVSDLVVDGGEGRGVVVGNGAAFTARRASITNTRTSALYASKPGTSIALEDARIESASADDEGRFGRCVNAQEDSHVALARVEIDGCDDTGIFVDEATVEATDVRVDAVSSRPSDGTFGRGIAVQENAEASLERVDVATTQDVGLLAIGVGSVVTGTQIAIRSVAEKTCATSGCADRPGGHGVSAVGPARLTLDGFLVDEAALCGVYVGADSEVDLTAGEVRRTSIGACVQGEGYDVGRLSDDVDYVDNAVNLDSVSLPVPEAGDTPGSLPSQGTE